MREAPWCSAVTRTTGEAISLRAHQLDRFHARQLPGPGEVHDRNLTLPTAPALGHKFRPANPGA